MSYQLTIFALFLVVLKTSEEWALKAALVGGPAHRADCTLFAYEMGGVCVARQVILTMAEERIVLAVSALSAVLEMATREMALQWHLYRASRKAAAGWTAATVARYAKRRAVLVANTHGDCVVEYVAAVAAALSVACFSGSLAFPGFGPRVPPRRVLTALALQLGPELVSDGFTVWRQLRCGMGDAVETYWARQWSWRMAAQTTSLVVASACVMMASASLAW